jgi:broad specificity phosphatase PhoE
MRLFIIRHGESTNNRLDASIDFDDYVHQRSHDPPLTALGERQAEAVAHHLAESTVAEHYFWNETQNPMPGYGITRIICSPMLRAMQTAQPIARSLGLQPEVMVSIHEHGGIFKGDPRRPESVTGHPGMTRSEIVAQFPDYVLPDEISETGWWRDGFEDMPGCYARAARTVLILRQLAEEFADQEREERVVLVSHATFIDCLIKAFLDQLPSTHNFYVHYNTAITRIDLHASGRQYLRYVNRTEHFTPELFSALTAASI